MNTVIRDGNKVLRDKADRQHDVQELLHDKAEREHDKKQALRDLQRGDIGGAIRKLNEVCRDGHSGCGKLWTRLKKSVTYLPC
jgi:hypothetical protein